MEHISTAVFSYVCASSLLCNLGTVMCRTLDSCLDVLWSKILFLFVYIILAMCMMCRSVCVCALLVCVNVMNNYVLIINILRYILLHGILQLTVPSDSGVPRNFVRWGGRQIQLRTEDRENGDLGTVAP